VERLFGTMLSLYRGTPNHGEWIVACLAGAWPKLVGDRLAEVCRPVAYKNSELKIEISDRSWESAVKSIQPELLEKLRTATSGEVTALSITTPAISRTD
jgi:hypothetical protein